MLYHQSYDFPELLRDYPIGDAFVERFSNMGRDELRRFQEHRFLRCVDRAWQIPFYQRLWTTHGLEPGAIRSLDDLELIPIFSKSDLMQSVADHPPLGDYHGYDPEDSTTAAPLLFQTTSGTTGTPQPLFFSPLDREVQALLLARLYRLQGLREGDVVHSVYGHGTINGGHYVRETFHHFMRCLFLSAGTGLETRSKRQIELMQTYGVTVIVGFVDYIKKLAQVAEASGIDPAQDLSVRMISGHVGRESRERISAAWGGAEVFDWYGVGDTGAIAGEGASQDGMHIMEDAQLVEICDIDTGKPVPRGDEGDLVVTCLYKDRYYPIIRFNTHDVSAFAKGDSPEGLCLDRLIGIRGRSDSMVKLRGINVFPQALGRLLENEETYAGDYLCEVQRDADGRDTMLVHVESHAQDTTLADQYEAMFANRIGVAVSVSLCEAGSLAPRTGVDSRQKAVRLVDRRKEKL